jgi:hypothetical protein
LGFLNRGGRVDEGLTISLSQLARAYGEDPPAVSQELRRDLFPDIPGTLGKPGTSRAFPLRQSVPVSLYLWLRRRSPRSRLLAERASDFAPVVARIARQVLLGRRRSLGALVVITPSDGGERRFHTDDVPDLDATLRAAIADGASFQVLPLLPILRPLLGAIAEAAAATMPGATARVPDVDTPAAPTVHVTNVPPDRAGMRVDHRGIFLAGAGAGLLQPMTAAEFRKLAATAAAIADEIEGARRATVPEGLPTDPGAGGTREGAGVPAPAPSPEQPAAREPG